MPPMFKPGELTPGAPSGASVGTLLDVLIRWTEKVAENTAQARDLLAKGRGGGAGAGGGVGPDPDSPNSRFERALDALGRRFESALSRWSRAPVEKLVGAGLDRSAQLLSAAAGTLLSQSRGLAGRGMSGTVEQARFDYAQEQLARQFAAITAPLTNGLTYLMTRLTGMMQGLDGAGQNRLLGTGLGAVAGGRLGGPLGFLAGGAIGSALGAGGGRDTGDALRGAAAGAYAGFRLAGPYGLLPGAVGGAAVGSPASYQSERPFEYYNRMRAGGGSAVGAAASVVGEAFARPFTGGAPDPGSGAHRALWEAAHRLAAERLAAAGVRPEDVAAVRERGVAPLKPGAGPTRRDVTPFSAEMGEAGSGYFRMQAAVIRATAGADFEDLGPIKVIIDAIIEVGKFIVEGLTGVRLPDPPASAERVRP